jgi:hypothetical protein
MKNMLFFAFLALSTNTYCQMGINTQTPDQSARLDIYDTSKGVLVPRLTNSQMNAIPSPATGLLIFNSQTESFYYRTASKWVQLLPETSTLKIEVGNNLPGPIENCIFLDITLQNNLKVYIGKNGKWFKI